MADVTILGGTVPTPLGARTGRDTVTINQDRRVDSVSDDIWLLEPDETPLVILLRNLRKMQTGNPQYKILEDVLFPSTAIVAAAGYDASTTTIPVDDSHGVFFKKDDIVQNTRTGEVMKVDATGTTTFEVTRSLGATVGTAGLDNDEILRLGNANEEGAGRPQIKTTKVVTTTNFTQIFRTPFGATRTNMQSNMHGPGDRDYHRRKQMINHRVDMERAFMFGEQSNEVGDDGQPQRTTDGLNALITTNRKVTSGTLDIAEWEDILQTVFRFGSNTRFAICSPQIISDIALFARTQLVTIPTDKTFGISITRYISPHGIVNLVRDVQLEGVVYGAHAFLLDMEALAMNTMQDTVLRQNIQAPDQDGWEDEYLTETGLWLANESRHAVIEA